MAPQDLEERVKNRLAASSLVETRVVRHAVEALLLQMQGAFTSALQMLQYPASKEPQTREALFLQEQGPYTDAVSI